MEEMKRAVFCCFMHGVANGNKALKTFVACFSSAEVTTPCGEPQLKECNFMCLCVRYW